MFALVAYAYPPSGSIRILNNSLMVVKRNLENRKQAFVSVYFKASVYAIK